MNPEITPSADPEIVEAPSEYLEEEPLEADEPVEPTETLYDLPDGRKVNAEQVRVEYGNLMKDYTQKSQRLAEYERVAKPTEVEQIPDWKKPDYVPKNYAELIEIAETRAIERIREDKVKQDSVQQGHVDAINAQLEEIKKTDPKLDENALFIHANKYGFQDLTKAHMNLRAIEDAKLTIEQRTLRNVQSRKDAPIAGKPGTAPVSNAPVYGAHNQYGSALEYFQAHKS